MQLRISAWSIQNPIPVVVLFIALMVAGVAGYRSLQIKLFPDVSFPIVQVIITLPGAAASEVETQITREVEAVVSDVEGVDHVTSVVTLGLSVTTIEFEIGTDETQATDEVRAAVDGVRISLPRGIEEPVVKRFDVDSQPIVTYAVSAPEMTDVELSLFVDETVSRRVMLEDGVAQVARLGGVDREINVTLDPSRLEALGLTAPQVNDALRGFSLDAGGGTAQIGGRDQTVRVLGAAKSVDELRHTIIPTGDGRTVRLSDVANVNSGAAERVGFALLNGIPVVGFQVSKSNAASDVLVETNTDKAVADLSVTHPHVKFQRIISTATNTRNSFHATVASLLEGMLLAAVVVLVFLRDWRATIITALAMPISLVPSFAVMAALGFSLNLITLLALTLVIGILVDDAIVEIENIQKRIQTGQSPYDASIEGADAIGLAVLATTMTIVVVFLPVSTMGGLIGQFFYEFGLTVAVTVLFSLLVARMLTPLMAAYFMSPTSTPHPRKPFTGFYRRALDFALDHRWLSMAAGLGLFIGSLFLATLIPTGFTPPTDNGIVQMTIESAPGTSLEDTRHATDLLTQALRKRPQVDTVFATVAPQESSGVGRVTVLLHAQRDMTTQAFQESIRPLLYAVPDVRLGFGQSGEGGSTTVQILLSSEDGDALTATALQLEREMRKLPELANVHQATPRPGTDLVITLKPAEAARLGVTPEVVATIARVATIGDVDANTAKFNTGTQRLVIRVRLPGKARADLNVLGALRVPTTGGGSVPLSAVANLSFQAGATRIERFDRERRATIEGELNGVSLGQATALIDKLPVLKALPPGVTKPAFGQSEDQADLFDSFGNAILAGIGMILAVLVLLFRSFFKPATILAALPLSLAGAFLALLVGGSELGLPALIGLLMLMGVAAKNSILLVEFAIEAERAGATQREALIEACRERARPIVMTTFAMAAGMLPTAMGFGEGSEFRVPMAIAVIGGLISSTVLSLVLVPVVYELIDDFEVWLVPKLGRLVTARESSRT
ncbi:HAE1 family hydrophobic/amphiphilic exporter-1 [Panacagrimonas perspica]|uniref:HAE1 family hydrophobic/amphiphilic exporter-1 n=1 Tax=Panacagrimonas perspica TaxID=381431 RepID=A0A4S3K025_9GAMM|nr:efflux RND transporter permease subunit [Panacagrimonas perspica]TDU32163.1 HAE1 family hydrophobic/amphiphilic exporter-1 [Panacagrimonas perspica]THD01138.1 multidrug transporter AcrB [Panacagrimonas perspica]